MSRPVAQACRGVVEVWRHQLTDAGRWVLAAISLSFLVAGLSLLMPIYYLFLVLVFLWISPLWVVWLYRPRIEIRGELPELVTAGERLSIPFQVRHRSGPTAHDVGLGFFSLPRTIEVIESPALPDLYPGEQRRLFLTVRPRKRGWYPLGSVRAYTTFPLNFFRLELGRLPVRALTVAPRFHSLVSLDLPVGSRYQAGGVALASQVGESPEYIGNRDYRPGDPIRRIDFRSWARIARPVVREYQEEYYCRVALVLDTYLPQVTPRRIRDLEAAVSLAAAVAEALTRGEYLIDLFAAGPELYVFRAGRSIAHFDNILEILACIEPCLDHPFLTVGPALVEELTAISAVVYVLLDWDESRSQFVRLAVESGCRVKTIVVRSGNLSTEPGTAESWAGPVVRLNADRVDSGEVDSL